MQELGSRESGTMTHGKWERMQIEFIVSSLKNLDFPGESKLN